MAAYALNSQSLRGLAQDPVTPAHSPHHSIHSSSSSRTPLHTLTLHEYRKQQNTPISRTATPQGKSLRRKAAGAALNGVERNSPISCPPLSTSYQPVRPLHISQSAQQLTSHQTVSTSPPNFHQQALNGGPLRSQSAEPTSQFGAAFGNSISGHPDKVRYFKPIKKLPKPPFATGSAYPVPLLATVKPRPPGLSPLQTSSTFSTIPSYSSDAQPTPSTFSLSRFPQPPHLIDPSLSPPHDENEPPQLNSATFVSTAPETPPATPAVIHYRGTSFDLVNPHDSLLFHDIVTPSREIDSSDYLPLRSSEDPLVSPEMAPKRPLYGNLYSAHASITGRNDDASSSPSQTFPQAPTPAAISPHSSQYTSPFYSPDSNDDVSSPSTKKPANESRFSLKSVKQLTRSLTKKLGKTPEIGQGTELTNLNGSNVSIATINVDGNYPRPLDETYIITPTASHFPIDLPSPVSPDFPPRRVGLHYDNDCQPDFSNRLSNQRYASAPLASMIPEEDSTQLGRGQDGHVSISEENLASVPYYDDMASIYPSSSIYTGDGRVVSRASNRKSNPFRLSSIDPESFAYNRDSLYDYGSSYRASQGAPRPRTQDYFRGSSDDQGDSKADTISKFIDRYDQYDQGHFTRNTDSMERDQSSTGLGLVTSNSGAFKDVPLNDGPPKGDISSLSQFEFGVPGDNNDIYAEPLPVRLGPARKPTITHKHRTPPLIPAPLAPAFRHDQEAAAFNQPEPSGMFSNTSSYGDTRNLLCLTPQKPGEFNKHERVPTMPEIAMALQPSSSYSQPEEKSLLVSSSYSQPEEKSLLASSSYSQPEEKSLLVSSSYSQPEAQSNPSPRTPQEALDHAEQIFDGATIEGKQPGEGIPAIWAKRNSGHLLRNKRSSQPRSMDAQKLSEEYEGKRGSKIGSDGGDLIDWETVAGQSQGERLSLDSIADYSSEEGDRNSLGLSFNADGSLTPGTLRKAQQESSFYSHPSPLQSHVNPFSSSPPDLTTHSGVRHPSTPSASSPVAATDRGAVDQPYPFTPWTDPYGLSDKETQELLASGPNDDILFEDGRIPNEAPTHEGHHELEKGKAPVTRSPSSELGSVELERENTFEKFSVLGPKGNLTGTPMGTRMHYVGSSIANTSSPGASLNSSPYDLNQKSSSPGFYSSPTPATGSVTRIRNYPQQPTNEHERTPSQLTISRNPYGLEPVEPSSPLAGPSNTRSSMRSSTSHTRGRRSSRAAVPGQTKLRQMMLAPDAVTISSTRSQQSYGSRFPRDRASTIDTTTPLRPSRTSTLDPTIRTVVPHHDRHSPHILIVQRSLNEKEDAEKRKLEWLIFGLFCILPPFLLLYRWLGDFVLITFSNGRFRECSREIKRIALATAIVLNLFLIAGITIPICVLYSLGRL